MTKRHLGQNFLYNSNILKKMIQVAELSQGDTVVEIGPGPGRLTKLLAQRAKKVIAIEIDNELYEQLKVNFLVQNNVELIHGDALKFPFESIGDFKVVGNIPYYITTPLIFKLLEEKKRLKTMTLTIQKEVAERIVAGPGGKDYGVLSIMIQLYTQPELQFIIPREVFRPVPRVDSAVVHMKILANPSINVKDEKFFTRVVKTAFSQRRKTLANSLKSFGKDIKEILNRCGIDPQRRPETLSLAEFARLSEFLIQ
jgi:16S rRNA (adenine1518-N6/adenine1519-N6)-dimethyltransferase